LQTAWVDSLSPVIWPPWRGKGARVALLIGTCTRHYIAYGYLKYLY